MIFERYREESPNIEKSHVKFNYLDLLTSEYVNKEFIDMDTRYFGNGNIRNKFKEVEEDFLYKYLYEYDSQFEHGLWGVFCKTFLHNIAKKKYTPLRLKFFSDYFGLDRAFLSRKLSPVKLKMCA